MEESKDRNNFISGAVLIFILSFMTAIWVQWPYFVNDRLVQNDTRIHIWWMETFRDPELFPHDALAEMMKIKALRSPGFLILFRTLSCLIAPITLSKLLATILLPITTALIFLAGHTMGGLFNAAVSAITYLALSLHAWSSGIYVLDGLQRSFKDPVLILGVYSLAARKPGLTVLSIFLGLLFYPIAALIVTGMVLLDRILLNSKRSINYILKG